MTPGRLARPRVVGVTGLPCAGKSYIAAGLADGRADGAAGPLLKADDIGHEILERPEVAAAVARELGPEVAAAPDPAARRAAIARRVFADPAALAWLEGLIHPLVTDEVRRAVATTPGRAVVEAALLFEVGLERLCDAVLLVEAPRAVRLARAARRGWSDDELARREQRLLPLFSEERLRRLDTTLIRVDNSADDGFPPTGWDTTPSGIGS